MLLSPDLKLAISVLRICAADGVQSVRDGLHHHGAYVVRRDIIAPTQECLRFGSTQQRYASALARVVLPTPGTSSISNAHPPAGRPHSLALVLVCQR